ncbi:hypothetical protein DNU06_00480 [Putridiphycobacter roseus]|uniref:Outer membrane lipoprotein-sorting protein n=1 Tax=Putridiphycobacter roseus TaxID=2219161 RepID=A0A2W1NFS8_9FLAO|nr:DUF6503 family protein [Putridiphycobacter roseus]PZE18345.1 hypothetical protein DNU06_00480 [Putridiphycobacter roseus]
MKLIPLLFIALLLASCQESPVETKTIQEIPVFKNKGEELVYNFVQKVGNYEKLSQLKDVVYDYTYITPDQKMDSVTEKYIFDGELSYGKYHKHQRTLSALEGVIEQGYNGNDFWLKQNDSIIELGEHRPKVTFNRKTNLYWFTMMQKLLDPGLNYEFIGDYTKDNNTYDIVKVTFQSENDKPTDTYQLYINQKTGLVDQFLFTVMDFNVSAPNLMCLTYENVDGLLIPTKRKYTKANWDAEPLTDKWVNVSWSNIKFNNGLTKELFEAK